MEDALDIGKDLCEELMLLAAAIGVPMISNSMADWFPPTMQ